MSTFKVEVVQISKVENHPNADKLDIVMMDGKDWQCVSTKGNYKVGDAAVYFPIDSLLPEPLEQIIFGGAKVVLHNHRVKTIKLRGAISQGLVVRPETIGITKFKIGQDVTEALEVKKYEPISKISGRSNPLASSKKQSNRHFRKYTGIENAKNYNNIFEDGEIVSITEKIHGTNFRAGYVPFHADTLFKKVKKFLGIAPKYDFVFGSHNVQLQSKLLYKGYYDANVYSEAVVAYNLKEILKPGEVVYGEIYGGSIQKGYTYGSPERRQLALFDVRKDEKYLDTVSFRKWADERRLPIVPELYRGPFSKDKVLELRDGDSVLASSQKVREGVVVKPLEESTTYIGRKMLKFISDEYLLKNQDNESEPH